MNEMEMPVLLPIVLNLFDGGGTTPGGGTTASGRIAPGGGTTASGRFAPGGGTTASGRIAPGGRTTPSGRIAPGGGTTAGGRIAPGGGTTASGRFAPGGRTTASGGTTAGGRPGGHTAAEERQAGTPGLPMEGRQQRAVPPQAPEMPLAQRQRMDQDTDAREQARLQEQAHRWERSHRQLQDWSNQAAQVKALYPGFDLGQEARNRNFLSMLRSGVPVRQAYEVIHMDEIKAAAAAVQEKAVTANIKAKGTRPPENGAGASSGFTVKDDVSRLTPRDRAEMARRAARGEVITF